MSKVKDYYKILGVSTSADAAQIKQAFTSLAKQYPNSADPAVKDLKEAYDVLANPQKRAQYDSYMAKSGSNGNDAEDGHTGITGHLPNSGSAPAQTQRWEYLTLESSKNYGTTKFYINGEMIPELRNGVFINIVNKIGSDGWELVGISTVGSEQTFVFKRPTDKEFVEPKKAVSA
jgi:hypothetical protein